MCRALPAVRSIDLRGLVECIRDALQARQQNEMRDMVTLEGKPRVVARPHSDWQLFEARREIYGGIFDWHTIEGPALRIHAAVTIAFTAAGRGIAAPMAFRMSSQSIPWDLTAAR